MDRRRRSGRFADRAGPLKPPCRAWVRPIVAISLVMFAFTTILGWCVYGERSAIFLFGDRVLKPFRILYTIVVPIGALAQLDLVWILADTFNALMAFPNLIGVLLLSPVVFKTVQESTRP